MPYILITGGAGFIGSHLAAALLERGSSVWVVDNLSTGSYENIAHLEDNPAFKFVKGDITDAELMDELTEQAQQVYHLAAAVGVRLIAERPVHTIETNIGGTEVVLDVVNKYGCRVLIASSSEVYGKNESVPFAEDDDIVLGSTIYSRWAYACSKAIDEFLGLAFYQQYGLPVVIARFFNTIGPGQSGQYGMVVPRFVKNAVNNEPITIYGTGKQSRCFCYVADVVEAIIGLMESEQATGRVFNIGSNEEITIEALAQKIIELTASKSQKAYISYEQAYGKPIEDMHRRVPDISRIKETIGWQPRTKLDEALKRIIENIG